ncbi:hypothetical protein OROHE_016238 [Orobanche hederae]
MAPKSSEGETTKRAPTMDLSGAADVSSPRKKPKADDHDYDLEESADNEDAGDDDSDDPWVGIGERLMNRVHPDPEWDVDSFDGLEYESPEEGNAFDTKEDYYRYRRYKRQVFETKGFYVDLENVPRTLWYGVCPISDLDAPAGENITNREYLANLASLCVKKYNEEKGKTVELVNVVWANICGGSKWMLYITFMAREYPNGPLVEYQAKVMEFVGNLKPPFPILCRPSPKPIIQ